MGKFPTHQLVMPEVVTAVERRKNIERHAVSCKKLFDVTLNGLLHINLIDSYTLVAEYIKHDSFVFQAQYLCKLYDKSSRPVLISLNIDQRQTAKSITEEVNTSDFSKFVMSPSFKQSDLFLTLRRRIVQWAKGVGNEALFMEFLKALKTNCPRICRVYRPSGYDDRNKGVDFVVSLLTKPYYEVAEVKFNLKSSDNYLEKHKLHHPRIGTFICSKRDMRIDDPVLMKALKIRFFRFLLLCVASKDAVHV